MLLNNWSVFMKNLILGLSLISILSSTSAFAGPREDLENELKDDKKCLAIATKAIDNKTYKVDWSQFNFKNQEEEAHASHVAHALDAYLGKLVNEKYDIKSALSGKGKLYDEGYQRANDEYEYLKDLREDLSNSWSQAAFSL